MKSTYLRLSLLFFILLLSVGCDRELTNEDRVDQIFSRLIQEDEPGVSVAIVKDGETIFQKGYGMANLEYGIPITESTIFHIASVSKQFTVFSVLLLEKEGKLNLDDDIRLHVPEVPDFGKTITLRHLASHTSGLRDHWEMLRLAGWRMDDVITTEHILNLVKDQKELNFDPGEDFMYSNTGFALLAEVVSRVSGLSFARFTNINIFKPLNMTNTLFYDDHEKIVENRAYSYYWDISEYKKSVLNYANVGATSLFTTAEDMCKWALNFSTCEVGDYNIIDTMNELAQLNDGYTSTFALGQFVDEYKGLERIFHSGGDAGYRSHFVRFPDQNLSIIVLSNVASFEPWKMTDYVADIYLKDQFVEASAPDSDYQEILIEKEDLDYYEGQYELEPGNIISIRKFTDILTGELTNQYGKMLLRPLSESVFHVRDDDVKLEFDINGQGRSGSLKLHRQGRVYEALRMEPFDKSAIDLSQYAGRYYSEELSVYYELFVKNKRLIARQNRLGEIFLRVFSEDTFNLGYEYPNAIRFERNNQDEVIGFRYSSFRAKNVKFDKVNSD